MTTKQDIEASLPHGDAAKYSWQQVRASLGPPTDRDRQLYAIVTPPGDLIAEGNQIASPRILTDLLRWTGDLSVWFAGATDEQKAALGLPLGLLRMTVDEALVLADLLARSKDAHQASRSSLAADQAALAEASDEGKYRRELLRARLSHAVSGSEAGDSTVASAHGTIPDDPSLVRALRELVKLGRSLLASPSSLPAQRLEETFVTPALLDASLAMADRIDQLQQRTSGATQATPVTQAALDEQDGRCLLRMERIKDLVQTGRHLVPSVPQLSFLATAHYFRSHLRRRAPSPAPAPGPAGTPGLAGGLDRASPPARQGLRACPPGSPGLPARVSGPALRGLRACPPGSWRPCTRDGRPRREGPGPQGKGRGRRGEARGRPSEPRGRRLERRGRRGEARGRPSEPRGRRG